MLDMRKANMLKMIIFVVNDGSSCKYEKPNTFVCSKAKNQLNNFIRQENSLMTIEKILLLQELAMVVILLREFLFKSEMLSYK